MAGRTGAGGRTAVPRLSVQRSMMVVETNPFEKAAAANTEMHVERLTDCVPISSEQFQSLKEKLQAVEANENRLKLLETQKLPYLFTSLQLITLCELTTSLKTRLAMIKSLGPRLTDPRAETTRLTSMFRFAEEKQQVEDTLRHRFQAQQHTVFLRVEKQIDAQSPTNTQSPTSSGTKSSGSNTTTQAHNVVGISPTRRRSNPLGGRGGLGGRFGVNRSSITSTTAVATAATVHESHDTDGSFSYDDQQRVMQPLAAMTITEGKEEEDEETN